MAQTKKQISKQVSDVLESHFMYKKVNLEAQYAIVEYSAAGWEHRQHGKSLAGMLFDKNGMRAAMFKSDSADYDVEMVNEVRELVARGLPTVYFKSVMSALELLPALSDDPTVATRSKRVEGNAHVGEEMKKIIAALASFEDEQARANKSKLVEYVEVVLFFMLDALIAFVSSTKAEQWPQGCQPKVMSLLSELNETLHALIGKPRAAKTPKYKKQ